MPEPQPDVVFDCNVFLQAFSRAGGPAAECLRLAEQGRIQLHVSRPVAIECKSDFLVTRDKDLLSLRDQHSPEAKQLRQHIPMLRVVDPVELLEALSHAAG